jgi:hypothetical protein
MILLVVGVVVLASVLLGVYHSPNWLRLTSLMGVHLIRRRSRGCALVVMTLKRMGLPSKPAFG